MFCLLLIFCLLLSCIKFNAANLILTLSSRKQEINNSLKLISFCIDCPSPENEGSAAFGITAKHSLQEYFTTGELVYCVPNFAESPRIMNENQLRNRIAFVDRGLNGLLEKVLKIEQTGAVAVVIADDGRCNAGYTFCGPRAGSVADGGFAAFDEEISWRSVGIPVVLVNLQTAERLRGMMRMTRVSVVKSGLHNMTVLDNGSGSDGEDDNEEEL